ncbi:MAG TPA: hypothetical protein VF692_10120 [Pyrinomonadaceae bacterium]|jgi:hypothetical protein
MLKIVKIAEKHDENTEMKFVTRVKIDVETSEAERAAAKRIVNFAMKDAKHDENTAMKQDVA